MITTSQAVRPAAPIPGVYPDISFEEYLSWPYLNQSGAKKLLNFSPAHYKAEEDEETKSKARGTICHAGIWEPERFADHYAIGPDVKLNTKTGKEEWESFCSDHPGRYHVRGADGAAMLGVRESIRKHSRARKLLWAPGPCELSIVWDDPEIGVRCKARLDKYVAGQGYVCDLKTTRDARPQKFRWSVRDYSYHVQAAFNLHGLAAVGLAAEAFFIIAAETEEPHALMVYEIEDAAVEKGRREMLEALAIYKECESSGRWPAYDEHEVLIGLPERGDM